MTDKRLMLLLKKRYWLSLTIILTLLLVVRSFPASWLIYGVQQAAPGFQVAEVSGSLWQGTAGYSQWVDKGRVWPLGRLQWRLEVLSLFLLSPCLRFTTETFEQSLQGKACYSVFSGAATLKNADIKLPVTQIAPFFAVELEGVIDASVKHVVWRSQQLGNTDIDLLWRRASIYNGNQWIDLGDIEADILDDGDGGLDSRWQSVAAQPQPVAINVKAGLTNLAAQRPSMRITGSVKPGPGATALQPMLQFVGEPIGGGAYRIDINE